MKLKNGSLCMTAPALAAAAVLCTGALALGQSRPGPAPEAQADDMPVESRTGSEREQSHRPAHHLTTDKAPVRYQPSPLSGSGQLLWDHDGFVTHPGQGAGGWDVSMAHPGGAAGSNVRLSSPGPHFRVADRFVLTETADLTQIVTYGYETNAATPGWTAFNGNIWDGPPNDPNSNVLISITDATIVNVQVYRVFNGMDNLGNTQRPIHAIVWDATGIQLPDGEYWFDWQVEGGASGWANYTTLPDPQGGANTEVVFGDALQLTTVGWEDFGNGYDSPLEVYGVTEVDCPWDFNNDGVVDGADLGQLLANWGPCEDCDDCPWDVTGDCVVDGADLGQLLANWGDCPEPPPPPTGACCIGETCEELTQIECNAAGGEFLGVGTDCDGDPCELDCGHPFAGDCCEPNPTPYCDDEECCELICGQDPFCCGDFGGNWDSACAAAANQQCEVCDEEPEGLCAGHCGGMAPEGCWCDEACEGFGDCCPDVCEDCPELSFCQDPPECQDCGCPGGAIPEGEPCGSDTNGGCNSTPPVFDFVEDGDVICGSVWADAGTRDTDWFRVTVGSTGTVSGTVTSAAPQVVFIVNANWADCSGIAVVGDIGHSVECTPGTASASGLSPGSEVVVFTSTGNPDGSGIFDGYPCGSCDGGDWEYVLEISAP